MKTILVLVDFTETADRSVQQAVSLAAHDGGELVICHVAGSRDSDDDIEPKLQEYLRKVEETGLHGRTLIGHGNLFKEASSIVKHLQPDLVVVGTHGVRGLKQNIFGADIYRLVSGLPAPTLVVNDHADTVKGGYRKVLMPVSHHANYVEKIKTTSRLLSPDGEIVIFAISKPGLELDEQIKQNINAAKVWLEESQINFEYQEVDSKKYSLGYAKETLAAISDQEVDLISIMTNVSEQGALFGKMDKENLLVNQIGLQVLCTNS